MHRESEQPDQDEDGEPDRYVATEQLVAHERDVVE
jgi:hypothetical protein